MSARFDVCVFIGRCQPVHNGHVALLTEALAQAQHVIVVLGSAFHARSPKNPFTWSERAELVRLAVPENVRDRLSFVPVRDYYDLPRWVAAVQSRVHEEAGRITGLARPRIALLGHHKDASSSYLDAFAGWTLLSVARVGDTDGVSLRDAYFAAGGTWPGASEAQSGALAALSGHVPESTRGFLRAFAELPAFDALAQEWRMLADYKKAWAAAPYAPIFVTVDTVLACGDQVLLIKRGQMPGKDLWAVPGGFLEPGDTILESALRELHEETEVALDDTTLLRALKGSRVFDHPDRSLRGRTITHAFHFVLPLETPPTVRAGDDARAAAWLPKADLPAMEAEFHDDHFHILDCMLDLGVR